jgi:metal-sulfur cluster biosynthetic enzyme
MVRVSGQYAANLGEEREVASKKEKKKREEGSTPFDEDIWEALKNVFDPEIPVNIVDLGLIYSMEVKPITEPPPASPKDQRYKVWIKMTLTAPGCGMGPSIAADARERVLQVDGVSDAQVDIVWDPPWNQSMISEEGRMALGMV